MDLDAASAEELLGMPTSEVDAEAAAAVLGQDAPAGEAGLVATPELAATPAGADELPAVESLPADFMPPKVEPDEYEEEEEVVAAPAEATIVEEDEEELIEAEAPVKDAVLSESGPAVASAIAAFESAKSAFWSAAAAVTDDTALVSSQQPKAETVADDVNPLMRLLMKVTCTDMCMVAVEAPPKAIA